MSKKNTANDTDTHAQTIILNSFYWDNDFFLKNTLLNHIRAYKKRRDKQRGTLILFSTCTCC